MVKAGRGGQPLVVVAVHRPVATGENPM